MTALLVRCTEGGVLYGARTNSRVASTEKLRAKHGLPLTMEEYAYTSGKENEFNNTGIAVIFYKMARTKVFARDTPRLMSIAKEDLECGDIEEVSTEVEIAQTSAKYVDAEDFKKLTYILNIKPRESDEQNNKKGLFDYESVLRYNDKFDIKTNAALKVFLKEKLRWDFFNVDNSKPVSYNLWKVRSFLQVITPVGISILEGGHRMTLASKLLTGVKIDQRLPLTEEDIIQTRRTLPVDSPLYSKIEVQVLTAVDQGRELCKHQYMTEKTMETCRAWSSAIAEQKTHFIAATWRDWMETTMKELTSSKANLATMSIDDFMRIRNVQRKRKGTDKYLHNLRRVVKIVCECLFTKIPAKSLAESSTRLLNKNEKDMDYTTGKVEQKAFTNYCMKTNYISYTHNVCQTVSKTT
jgi:hypothetical protein